MNRSFPIVLALLVGLMSSGNARADSFFDVYTELWDTGQVVMQPIDSQGAFPFPPPPLDFPELPSADGGTVQIEMVSLSLRSSAPLNITHDPAGSSSFVVDTLS